MRRLPFAALLVLAGCHLSLLDRKVAPLPVSEVSLAFPTAEEGRLAFAFELPQGAGDVVSVWWDLSLDGRRFATGVEGSATVTEQGEGRRRVQVSSPVVLTHLGYREGPTYLQVLVRGEVRLKRRGVDGRLPFSGAREVMTQGAPVTREPLTE